MASTRGIGRSRCLCQEHLDQSFSRAEFEHSRSILLRRLATKADLKPQAFTSMFHDTQLEQQHETRTELHGDTDYPLRVACMTETWRSLPATACDDLANARGGRGHSTRTLNEPSWCWARPSTTSISASLPAPAEGRWPASRDRDDARELAGCRCGSCAGW